MKSDQEKGSGFLVHIFLTTDYTDHTDHTDGLGLMPAALDRIYRILQNLTWVMDSFFDRESGEFCES
jgi:hypothetical protein